MTKVLIARFLFDIAGTPVGTVELSLDAQTYSYRSTHAYRRTSATRTESFPLRARPVPEGLWLWRRPDKGCIDGVAELSHERGRLCADAVTPGQVRGMSLGKPFIAEYDAQGYLTQLGFGSSHFMRTDAPLTPGQPYGSGFAVEGKGARLTLEPGVEGERWPEWTPAGTRQTPADEGSCLELAQALVARSGADARLAVGLVMEGDRAWPHAWTFSIANGDIDPSARAGERRSRNRTYLELPRHLSGRLFVELLEGRRRLVRR